MVLFWGGMSVLLRMAEQCAIRECITIGARRWRPSVWYHRPQITKSKDYLRTAHKGWAWSCHWEPLGSP